MATDLGNNIAIPHGSEKEIIKKYEIFKYIEENLKSL